MHRLRTLIRSMLVVIALGMVASAMAQQSTVRMWTFLNPTGTAPREVALRQIIDDFEAANPDIRVQVEPQVWDRMTPQFLAAHGAGNAPDIIWAITDLLGTAISAGALEDLNDMFAADWPSERRDAIDDAYWRRCQVDGNQYCIFTSRNYIGLMYRADVFAEAGVEPSEIQTWDDLLAVAERLTERDGAGNVTRWGLGQQFSTTQSDPQLMVPYMLERQGDIFDEDGSARFATEAGVEALTFQVAMVTDHDVTPRAAVNWSAEDLYEQFVAGRLAMINAASVRVSTIQEQLGRDNVDFMLWPSAEAGSHAPGVSLGWAVGIWSGSQQKDAASRFLDYMTGPQADALWVEVGGQIPMRSTTIDDLTAFFEQSHNRFLATTATGFGSFAYLTPIEFDIGGWRQDLNQAAQDVIVGGLSPQQALEQAEQRFNQRNR